MPISHSDGIKVGIDIIRINAYDKYITKQNVCQSYS